MQKISFCNQYICVDWLQFRRKRVTVKLNFDSYAIRRPAPQQDRPEQIKERPMSEAAIFAANLVVLAFFAALIGQSVVAVL